MDRRLLRPRWLAAHGVVLVVGAAFLLLGFWQLGRLEERQEQNAVLSGRFDEDPMSLESVIADAEDDLSAIDYRRTVVTGTYDPANEVLIRSQVYLASSGFHVITPLVDPSGQAVLVNRGWVPLALDSVPVGDAPPPTGEVTVEGWVQLSQKRPALGPEDPAEGRLATLNRVDIERIQAQIDYPLAPVYLVEIGAQGTELPVPLDLPDFTDEGPHFAYAMQWFGFAVVLFVGYFFLARHRLARPQEDSGTRAKSSTTS